MAKGKTKIVMLLGSKSDLEWANEIGKFIQRFGVEFEIRIASAHKSPEYALKILKEYEKGIEKIVFLAIAGRSNALGGFMDGNTIFPVINCPPKSNSYGGMDILSSLRMPGGIGAATVLEPDNAAILAIKILSFGDDRLVQKIADYHKSLVEKIKRDDHSINPKL